MAAAYAALMSLMHTSERILHPSQQWLRIHRNMIGSLLQKVRSLQEFFQDYSHRGHQEMAGLEKQVAVLAHGAEDVIESHVLDQILARCTGSEAKSSTSFSQYIHQVIEEMEDLIENKLMRIKETIEGDMTFIDYSPAVASRSAAPKEQITMVGNEEKLNELLDILTGQQSNCQMVAIVGMGGIGKTTLAKNVYEHPLIKHHFDIRAWATISQKHSARNIISDMLSEIGQSRSKSHLSEQQLGEQLHRNLHGRRYLIVMDDFWSTDAWYEIKRFFPDYDCNGSRILITTRERNAVADLSSCLPLQMGFLDEDRSWELLSKKVFGEGECPPPELEKLGKNIAKNCGGLPLAIVVIGGLLSNSHKTTLFWEHVEDNLNSIINSEDNEKCQKILYLSYNNLPIHLKPCFLCLAMAQERSYICEISWLINVWVSEGFVKPMSGKSLEEAAQEYLTDLSDRNLIFDLGREFLGKSVICRIHDLLTDLCLIEAQKINLCGVIDLQNPAIPLEMKFMRGIRFRDNRWKPKMYIPYGLELVGQASVTRFIISGGDNTFWLWYATNFRLLRVLDTVDRGSKFLGLSDMTHKTFPDNILRLINLRLISFDGNYQGDSISRFTSSISLFWNLQTFQVRVGHTLFLPQEIWCLPHLRHLECNTCVLPDPPAACREMDKLENLHTLSVVVNLRCGEEVCTRLPNLKELRIVYAPSPGVGWSSFRLHNLVHLQKLESLLFQAHGPTSLKYVSFPLSLKELTLSSCRLPWEDMSIVGSLPTLEVLQLLFDACEGQTWFPIQGHFVRLKVLKILHTDLVHWGADKTHFPVLEYLILENLNLEEFPQEFGEHPTLGAIEVLDCSASTKEWAEQIREEQESYGNEGFLVKIVPTPDSS